MEDGTFNLLKLLRNISPEHSTTNINVVFYSPVFEVFGFHLGHLAAGEVKHLLAEQFEDDHVVLTEALARPTCTHNVADESGPVFGPLLLQDLKAE